MSDDFNLRNAAKNLRNLADVADPQKPGKRPDFKYPDGIGHVSTEDVRNCIDGTCHCECRAAVQELREMVRAYQNEELPCKPCGHDARFTDQSIGGEPFCSLCDVEKYGERANKAEQTVQELRLLIADLHKSGLLSMHVHPDSAECEECKLEDRMLAATAEQDKDQ